MKIVYAGDFARTWHTETHVARELEGLGHDVHRFSGPASLLQRVGRDADLVLLQANGGLGRNAVAALRHLEAAGVRTASYHLDLYAGLARAALVDHDVMFQTQLVFTADGDPATHALLEEKGVDHWWLPPAVVSDETERGSWRPEYDYDVVFVGAEHYHPEWPWRSELLTGLAARYGTRFKIFGHHPPTRDRDLNDLYATARVVVGDSLCLPGHTRYWSDRYFETIGRGGFLIAPRVPGLEQFLTDGQHFVGYDIGHLDRLASLIDLFLEEPAARERIRAAGHAHVAAHHTYRHRATRMLAALQLPIAA